MSGVTLDGVGRSADTERRSLDETVRTLERCPPVKLRLTFVIELEVGRVLQIFHGRDQH